MSEAFAVAISSSLKSMGWCEPGSPPEPLDGLLLPFGSVCIGGRGAAMRDSVRGGGIGGGYRLSLLPYIEGGGGGYGGWLGGPEGPCS